MNGEHRYRVRATWTGNRGRGTPGYRDYDRAVTLSATGKPDILASSDAPFRGDSERWNPEDLLVAALAECHLLSYLHACVTAGVSVVAYRDEASGVMRQDGGNGGSFTEVILRPQVTVAAADMVDAGIGAHRQAHEWCFIANSVNFPVRVEPTVSAVSPEGTPMTHSFDERAATWDDEPTVARARSLAATIREAVPIGPRVRLLEYGAGTGLVAQFLAPHIGPVTLADSSTGMLQVAREKVTTGALPASTRLWHLDLDTGDAPDEQFDLIVTALALHHVGDVPGVLAKLTGLLAPDGRLCIVDLQAEDGSFHDHSDEVAHGFDEKTMVDALTGAGLSADYRPAVYHIDKNDRRYPLFLAVGTPS